MASRQTIIFATRGDVQPGLKAIESSTPLHYVAVEMYGRPVFEEYDLLLGWPGLGINSTGTTAGNKIFLVCHQGVTIRYETVPQRKRGNKYTISQTMNPDTIVFAPGGLYENSALIAGNFGTVSTSPVSLDLYKQFRKAIIRDFKNIKGIFVGSEALTLMQQGIRLTHHVKASKEYDLTP